MLCLCMCSPLENYWNKTVNKPTTNLVVPSDVKELSTETKKLSFFFSNVRGVLTPLDGIQMGWQPRSAEHTYHDVYFDPELLLGSRFDDVSLAET